MFGSAAMTSSIHAMAMTVKTKSHMITLSTFLNGCDETGAWRRIAMLRLFDRSLRQTKSRYVNLRGSCIMISSFPGLSNNLIGSMRLLRENLDDISDRGVQCGIKL